MRRKFGILKKTGGRSFAEFAKRAQCLGKHGIIRDRYCDRHARLLADLFRMRRQLPAMFW